MIEHEASYLADNDYEEVYVSSVVHPALFYVQRTEQIDTYATCSFDIFFRLPDTTLTYCYPQVAC